MRWISSQEKVGVYKTPLKVGVLHVHHLTMSTHSNEVLCTWCQCMCDKNVSYAIYKDGYIYNSCTKLLCKMFKVIQIDL